MHVGNDNKYKYFFRLVFPSFEAEPYSEKIMNIGRKLWLLKASISLQNVVIATASQPLRAAGHQAKIALCIRAHSKSPCPGADFTKRLKSNTKG